MDKLEKKALRRRFGSLGWAMLVYTIILNVAVMLVAAIQVIPMMVRSAMGNAAVDEAQIMNSILGSGWGYLLAIAVGALCLRLWKGKQFCRQTLWTRGRPMRMGDFLTLLCLMVGGQLIFQLLATVQELLLNLFGFSALHALEAATISSDTLSMFLYVGIFGPISEELLFRGLVLRPLEPYGKRFAVLVSAFLFAIFHGNVVQTPYAFCVGLVLGYTAIEYSIAWSMVLHMFNNMVLADTLSRLTATLPEVTAVAIQWIVILIFSLGGLIVTIRRRKDIRAYIQENKVNNRYAACFFRSAGIIVLMLVSMVGIVLSVSRL